MTPSSAAAICRRCGTWIPPRDGRGSQPLVHRRDEDGRLVTDREFSVLRGDGAVPLEAVDPALHRMTLAVVDRAEARWPATAGSELSAIVRLASLVGDGAADPAAAQVGAVLTGGTRLVRANPVGADAWPTQPNARHADLLQDGLELRRVRAARL